MRISDWSSDVCSSDLCRIDYSITSGNLEVKTRKARFNESPPQSDPVKFATRGDMEMPTRHYAARFSLSDLRSIPPVLCRPESRSEEHTSELQSLMRLSYAVFCLQKQTPHNTHYTLN